MTIVPNCGTIREIEDSYLYDAWGNCTIGTNVDGMAELNPIRYRGYYYDNETGLYYLQTRYYDPATGRFISPDTVNYLDPETIHGLNLYAYGLNNPVMYVDPTGHFVLSTWMVGGLVGFGVSFVSSLVSQALVEQELNWEMVGIAAIDGVFGAISGALGGAGFKILSNPLVSGAIDAGLTFLNSVITTAISNDGQFSALDWMNIGANVALDGILSFGPSLSKTKIDTANNAVKTVRTRKSNGYYGKRHKKVFHAIKATQSAEKYANSLVFDVFKTGDAFRMYGISFCSTVGVASLFGGIEQWKW